MPALTKRSVLNHVPCDTNKTRIMRYHNYMLRIVIITSSTTCSLNPYVESN